MGRRTNRGVRFLFAVGLVGVVIYSDCALSESSKRRETSLNDVLASTAVVGSVLGALGIYGYVGWRYLKSQEKCALGLSQLGIRFPSPRHKRLAHSHVAQNNDFSAVGPRVLSDERWSEYLTIQESDSGFLTTIVQGPEIWLTNFAFPRSELNSDGRDLMDELKVKLLVENDLEVIVVPVARDNLAAGEYFRSQGFEVGGIDRKNDHFLMRYPPVPTETLY